MAVPAEIRAVPRPVNTIVDDSGTNSPKRYAVRQRASSKYIPGGNPQPKNGKVIGHIIDCKSSKRSIQHHVHCDSSCHETQDHSWKNGYPLP